MYMKIQTYKQSQEKKEGKGEKTNRVFHVMREREREREKKCARENERKRQKEKVLVWYRLAEVY